jgi:hypothetical protein
MLFKGESFLFIKNKFRKPLNISILYKTLKENVQILDYRLLPELFAPVVSPFFSITTPLIFKVC